MDKGLSFYSCDLIRQQRYWNVYFLCHVELNSFSFYIANNFS